MKKVSESTVGRLSLYLRVLMELEESGQRTLSSEGLAERCGTTAAQVRKDLSFFGTFGKRGLGYGVAELIAELRSILGLERRWSVALVGVGRMGSALLGYRDFRRQGFFIEAAFDTDPAKIGEERHEVPVLPLEQLEPMLSSKSIDIVIVAVPAEAAQRVVDRVVKAGVRAILNFAPTKLNVPPDVVLKTVNMVVELEGLSFALANGERRGRRTRQSTGATAR